jgi:hypothetical protein
MGYNLNFFPNGYNQPNYNNFNPYGNLLGLENNPAFQNIHKNVEDKLNQVQQIQNQFIQQNTQQENKPYYLFCGNKSDWDEFLILNYGITEQAIFDDYKLFLQAKQELIEEQGQQQKNTMKDKIRNNNKGFVNVDSTVQSNVKPTKQPKPILNRECVGTNVEYTGEPNNGLLEHNTKQEKKK